MLGDELSRTIEQLDGDFVPFGDGGLSLPEQRHGQDVAGAEGGVIQRVAVQADAFTKAGVQRDGGLLRQRGHAVGRQAHAPIPAVASLVGLGR